MRSPRSSGSRAGERKKSLAPTPPSNKLATIRAKRGLGLPSNSLAIVAARKITEFQRVEICDQYETGTVSLSDLAKVYNIDSSYVWKIVHKDRPEIFLDAQLAKTGVVEEDLLDAIKESLTILRSKLKKANAQQAAVITSVLFDKWFLLTGRPNSRTAISPSSNKDPNTEIGRDRALALLGRVGDSLERIASMGTGGTNKPSPQGPQRLHGADVSGSGKEDTDQTTMVSSGMAEGDDEGGPVDSNRPSGSRQDDSDSSGSGSMGIGEQPGSKNQDSLPERREGEGEALRDNNPLGDESSSKGSVPEVEESTSRGLDKT